MNKTEIKRRYGEMLVRVKKEYGTGVKPGRCNCYFCTVCGHVTKTIDITPGVTPFVHHCETCGGAARSAFYRLPPSEIGTPATQEWYRPTLDETLVLAKRGNDGMIQHIMDGGLLCRNRS